MGTADSKSLSVPPHVANVPDVAAKSGTYDVPNKDKTGVESASSKHQLHYARPHPPKQKAGGDEFDHANQGPTSTQDRGEQ